MIKLTKEMYNKFIAELHDAIKNANGNYVDVDLEHLTISETDDHFVYQSYSPYFQVSVKYYKLCTQPQLEEIFLSNYNFNKDSNRRVAVIDQA